MKKAVHLDKINVNGKSFSDEMFHDKLGLHKRSITPDTLKEVFFDSSEEDIFYQENYSYKNSFVTRFALNVASKDLINQINGYNKIKKDAIDTKSLTSIANAKDPLVTLENCVSSSKKIISDLELKNTNIAIKTLQNGAKAVLIDIFDRDADYNVKVNTETSLYKIHTVVLYEQFGKYLAIDPSNAIFSYVLAAAHPDIRLCFSNKLQIYTPPSEKSKIGEILLKKYGSVTGADIDQYRDCIDIAVKLAFNLKINEKLGFINEINVIELGHGIGYIDFPSLKESVFLKEVTNQKSMCSKLPKIVESHSMRAKQSSEIKQEKKITTLLKYIDSASSKLSQKIEDMDLYHVKSKIGQKFIGIFEKSYSPVEYDKAIGDLYKFAEDMSNIAGITNDMSLLGEELKVIDELY